MIIAGLLGLLLGACAREWAAPAATTVPMTPALSMVGCFEGLQVAPAAPTDGQITPDWAEEQARARRGPSADALGELLSARFVTVVEGGSERLRGRPAWLLAFAFTPPPGQPVIPPPGLGWRAYALVDAETGAYSTDCVSLLPIGVGRR